MSNPTSNFGWQMPTSTDLVTDLPADFEVFGQAVDTSLADLKGGTSGQVLSKNSNTDMDFTWIDNQVGDITSITAGTGLTGGGTSGDVTLALSSPVAATNGGTGSATYATGDILYSSATNTLSKLAIGTTGQVLNVSGGVPAWTTISTGGITLITSGTLSGTTTTISSISGSYKNLYILLNNVKSASNWTMTMRINGKASVGDYGYSYYGHTGTTAFNAGSNAAAINLTHSTQSETTAGRNAFQVWLPNYAITTNEIQLVTANFAYEDSTAANNIQGEVSAQVKYMAAAVTSVSFILSSAATGGTYRIYGMN